MDDQATAGESVAVDKTGGQVPDTGEVLEPTKEEINAARQAGMAADEQQWAAEGIPVVEPPRRATSLADGAPARVYPGKIRPLPQQLVPAARVACEHCNGRGFMPGVNDHLRESIGLIGTSGDEVVRSFYIALFREAPDLVRLFPGDPREGDFGADHRGSRQRELLLQALAALSELYDPGDPQKMEQLDAALVRYGRAHAAFDRGDGTVRGATFEEYAAVKEALFTTLVKAAGEHWRPEFTEAWGQAYDYAAATMLREQFRSGFTAPRFARGGPVR